jgi:protein associated with RNAse G/E
MNLKNKNLTDNNPVTINSRKFDGAIHKSWKASLLETEDSLLIFVGKFEEEIKHPHLGVIGRGTISYEFYWTDRWYNVFRFHEPDGGLRNFYCNINFPPKFEDSILDYIDLDIDLLVWKDFSYQVLDFDEFEQNAARFSYPQEIYENALRGLDELVSLVKNKSYPFNKEF